MVHKLRQTSPGNPAIWTNFFGNLAVCMRSMTQRFMGIGECSSCFSRLGIITDVFDSVHMCQRLGCSNCVTQDIFSLLLVLLVLVNKHILLRPRTDISCFRRCERTRHPFLAYAFQLIYHLSTAENGNGFLQSLSGLQVCPWSHRPLFQRRLTMHRLADQPYCTHQEDWILPGTSGPSASAAPVLAPKNQMVSPSPARMMEGSPPPNEHAPSAPVYPDISGLAGPQNPNPPSHNPALPRTIEDIENIPAASDGFQYCPFPMCQTCRSPIKYKLSWRFELHMVEVHQVRPYHCHLGDCATRTLAFERLRDLDNHIYSEHKNEKGKCPFHCRDFYGHIGLAQHLRQEHPKEFQKRFPNTDA